MLYAVLFEDDAARAAMRSHYMARHLAFLEQNADAIQAAGPLAEAEDRSPAGGLWLVLANSLEEVRALYEADPFWPTGLRKAVRVLEWKQVFAGGERVPQEPTERLRPRTKQARSVGLRPGSP